MYEKSILKHTAGSIINGGSCGPAKENAGDSNNCDQFTEKHHLQENHTRMGLVLCRKKKKKKIVIRKKERQIFEE